MHTHTLPSPLQSSPMPRQHRCKLPPDRVAAKGPLPKPLHQLETLWWGQHIHFPGNRLAPAHTHTHTNTYTLLHKTCMCSHVNMYIPRRLGVPLMPSPMQIHPSPPTWCQTYYHTWCIGGPQYNSCTHLHPILDTCRESNLHLWKSHEKMFPWFPRLPDLERREGACF